MLHKKYQITPLLYSIDCAGANARKQANSVIKQIHLCDLNDSTQLHLNNSINITQHIQHNIQFISSQFSIHAPSLIYCTRLFGMHLIRLQRNIFVLFLLFDSFSANEWMNDQKSDRVSESADRSFLHLFSVFMWFFEFSMSILIHMLIQ